MIILHICTEKAWQDAQATGGYRADSLVTEGFIHCSAPAQLIDSANRFFAGQSGLVILFIDTDKLQAALKYELAGNGGIFPHIYGPLNLSAVTEVVPFVCGPEGMFTLPDCFS